MRSIRGWQRAVGVMSLMLACLLFIAAAAPAEEIVDTSTTQPTETLTEPTETPTSEPTETPTTEPTDTPTTEPETEPVRVSCAPTGSETVATDKEAYAPAETVYITGAGYAGDCDVVVRVTRPDGSVVIGDGTFAPGSETVQIPADGSLTYAYILNGITGWYEVDVIGADGAILASVGFSDLAVQLHTDPTWLTQNYIFRRGDTVYQRFDQSISGWVRFEVLDPSGSNVRSTTCTATTAFAGTRPTDSYTLAASAPLSTSGTWTYTMKRYSDAACATQVGVWSKSFYVAQAYAFATQAARDACTSDPCANTKSAFGLGQTAWVKVLGVNPNIADVSTEWTKPNTNRCRNSSGTDRPNSDASGGLGTGFRPADVGETPDTSPAAVAHCGAFAAGEQGVWTLRLFGLPTLHTVTFNVFTLDLTVPTVTLIKPPPPLPPVEPGDTGTSITFKADETGTYSVRVSGGAVTCTTGTVVESGSYPTANAQVITPIPVGDLVYGLNNILVCVTDGAGNTGSASTTVIRQVPTSLLYNGVQIITAGTNLSLGAKLTAIHSACALGNNKIAWTLDRNPITGGSGPYTLAQSINTNNSGQATTSVSTTNWLEGVYEITAIFTGTNFCAGSSDVATLTVAQPGGAANGGGWYTLSGAGRVNFGFTVRKVEGTTNEYKGQFTLINNGKWRLKGTLNFFAKTGNPPTGAVNGVGDLYVWSSTLLDWVLSEEDVSFTASFKDDGSGKKSNDTFGVHISHVLGSGEPGLPNSSPTLLKGGNITIHS